MRDNSESLFAQEIIRWLRNNMVNLDADRDQACDVYAGRSDNGAAQLLHQLRPAFPDEPDLYARRWRPTLCEDLVAFRYQRQGQQHNLRRQGADRAAALVLPEE